MDNQNNLVALSALQLDVIKEIGNIGAGNAATALSELLGSKVEMAIPGLKFLSFEEIVDLLGGKDQIMTSVIFELKGDIRGVILQVVQLPFANKITNSFLQKNLTDLNNMDDMEKSALSEVANIMTGNYVKAMAAFENMVIQISVPEQRTGTLEKTLKEPISVLVKDGDIMFVEEHFIISGNEYTCHMIMVPDTPSLNRLLQVMCSLE